MAGRASPDGEAGDPLHLSGVPWPSAGPCAALAGDVWSAADGSALLRAERRLRLATTDENPVELTLELDWLRKGERPVTLAEYKAARPSLPV